MPTAAALFLVVASLALAQEGVVERRVALMGTELSLRIEAETRTQALAVSERVVRELEAAEAELSTWRTDSALARLNAAPVGEAVALSPELAGELALAQACCQRTAGAFDATVGAVLAAWQVRSGGRRPAPEQLEAARLTVGCTGYRVGPAEAVRLRAGLVLEEGGFGKGAALDRALGVLAREAPATRALLDFGGQVASHRAAAGWTVQIADPRDRARAVLEIALDGRSLSTSGNGERGLVIEGQRVGHLFDPRSAQPARDFGSLTVLAPSGLEADCLSTGLYVLGPEAALRFVQEQKVPGLEVVVLEPTGKTLRARASHGLEGRLRVLVADLELCWGEACSPTAGTGQEDGGERTEGMTPQPSRRAM